MINCSEKEVARCSDVARGLLRVINEYDNGTTPYFASISRRVVDGKKCFFVVARLPGNVFSSFDGARWGGRSMSVRMCGEDCVIAHAFAAGEVDKWAEEDFDNRTK